MAFLVPDRDTYTRQLLPADVLDWAPGELVGPDEPFAQFLGDLDADGSEGAAQRAQVAAKIGLNDRRRDLVPPTDLLTVRSSERNEVAASEAGLHGPTGRSGARAASGRSGGCRTSLRGRRNGRSRNR